MNKKNPATLACLLVMPVLVGFCTPPVFAADGAAKDKEATPKLKPLSQDDMTRMMRSLAAVDANFKAFALTFPDAQPRILRNDPSGRVSIQADRVFGGYLVSFWTSAFFNDDYSEARAPLCEIFGATELKLLQRPSPRGSIISPIKFPASDVPAFCRDPRKILGI